MTLASNGTWFERRDYMFDYIGRSFVLMNVMNLVWVLPILFYMLYYTECGKYLKKTRERHKGLREQLIQRKKEELKKERREGKEKERKEKEEREKERCREELRKMLLPEEPPPPRQETSPYNTRSSMRTMV